MGNHLFDQEGSQTRPLVITGRETDLGRLERLLMACAKALGADLSSFDLCTCGCERDCHDEQRWPGVRDPSQACQPPWCECVEFRARA